MQAPLLTRRDEFRSGGETPLATDGPAPVEGSTRHGSARTGGGCRSRPGARVRAASAGADGLLLPHVAVDIRGGRRRARDARARVARSSGLRGPVVGALVVVQDRDERV